MTQPYALFIADILEDAGKPADIAGKAAAELRRLYQVCRDIYEVWAGSDGFVPETAPEAYQQQLIEAMRDLAKEGMR